MILVRALAPESFDDHLTQNELVLADPVYIALVKRMWHASDLEPDDPRVKELASAVADHLTANPAMLPSLTELQARDDGLTRYELLSHHGQEQSPAWARMGELIQSKVQAAGITAADQFSGWIR